MMIANTLMMAITAISYPGMCERPTVEAEEVECMEKQRLDDAQEAYTAFFERHADRVTPTDRNLIKDWVICENDDVTLKRGESGRVSLRINWHADYQPVITFPADSEHALAPLLTEHTIQTPGLGTGEAPFLCMDYYGGTGLGVRVSENPNRYDEIETGYFAYVPVDVHSSQLPPGVHTFKIDVTASKPDWRAFHTVQCELKVTVQGDDANDLDGDGVENSADQCANTCASSDIVDKNGCDLAQLCPCDNNWCDPESYVECVRTETRKLRRQKKITRAQRRELMRQARTSECGQRALDDDEDDLWNCETGFDLDEIWNWDNWLWGWL